MRIRVSGKDAKIKVRRVRKRQVVNPDSWTKFRRNHDSITKREWEVLRKRKEEEKKKRR